MVGMSDAVFARGVAERADEEVDVSVKGEADTVTVVWVLGEITVVEVVTEAVASISFVLLKIGCTMRLKPAGANRLFALSDSFLRLFFFSGEPDEEMEGGLFVLVGFMK